MKNPLFTFHETEKKTEYKYVLLMIVGYHTRETVFLVDHLTAKFLSKKIVRMVPLKTKVTIITRTFIDQTMQKISL